MSSSSLSIRQIRPAFLIFLGAFLIRVLHLLSSQSILSFEFYLNDGVYFTGLANALFGSNAAALPPAGLSPVYLGFLVFIFQIAGPDLIWPRLLQILLGSWVCAGLFQITRNLFGNRAGWIAGALSAFCGVFIYFDMLLIKPSLVNALLVLIFWIVFKTLNEKKPWFYFILGGTVWMTVCMLRMQLVIVLPWMIGIWMYEANKRRSAELLKGTLLFLAMMALVYFAWMSWFGSVVTKTPNAPSIEEIASPQAGIHLYMGNHEKANGAYRRLKGIRPSPVGHVVDMKKVAEKKSGKPLTLQEADRFWRERAWHSIRENWPRWLMLETKKMFLVWNAYEIPNNHHYDFWRKFSAVLSLPLISYGLLAPLGLVGWLCLDRDSRPMVYFFKGFAAFYILGLLITFVTADYRLPLHLIWIIFAASFIDQVLTHIQKKEMRWLGGNAALILIFILFCNYPTYLDRDRYQRSIQARYEKICETKACPAPLFQAV